MVQLSRLQTYKNPPRLMNRSMCLRRFHFLFAVNDNVVDCETLAGCSGYPRRVGARRSASIPPAASVLATTAHPGEPGKDRSQSKHRQPVATPSRQRNERQRRHRRSVRRELEKLLDLIIAGVRLRRRRKARKRMHHCSVQRKGGASALTKNGHLCSPKVTQAKNSTCRRARENHISSPPMACPLSSHHPLRCLARSQFAPKVIHLGRKARSRAAFGAPNSTANATLQPWRAGSPAKLVQVDQFRRPDLGEQPQVNSR